MHYGLDLVNLAEYVDPRVLVRLSQAAEQAGWEGLFLWDHLGFVWGAPSGDPWIMLAIVAAAAARLKVGTAVSPLPRYRPHLLAQTVTTLDIMSGGRVVLGVGLGGVAEEYTAFGESGEQKVHAAMLDESLLLLDRLWSGELVTHHGAYYTVHNITLQPLPIQRPRIPLWVGGESLPALRRAARWDGWIVGGVDQNGSLTKTPEEVARMLAGIMRQRTVQASYDVALIGQSMPADSWLVREYASAGVTWWLESLHGFRGTVEEMIARVKDGPPR